MTQSEHLNQIALNIAKQGRQQVIDNPNQFGLFTEQQVKELMRKAINERPDVEYDDDGEICYRYEGKSLEELISDFKQQNGITNE